MRPWDDVHRHQFANAARRGGAGVGRCFHGADVAAHHRIGSFDRSDETFRFNESERFLGHAIAATEKYLVLSAWCLVRPWSVRGPLSLVRRARSNIATRG